MEKITYIIKCGFCEAATGEVEIMTEIPEEELTNEMLGIADSRCDDCLLAKGEYKP